MRWCLLLLVAVGTAVGSGVPVYVMLPLNVLDDSGMRVNNVSSLVRWLEDMRSVGVQGVATDVWWGLVEQKPKHYNWEGYVELAAIVEALRLEMLVSMSFHACGQAADDLCDIPLPAFVRKVGDADPNVWYNDQEGTVSHAYISLAVDDEPIFEGRSPLKMYSDFMESFSANFSVFIQRKVISNVAVSLGPLGQLRYTSFRFDQWAFCGIGEFQSFGTNMQAKLARAAAAAHKPEWNTQPSATGTYNSKPYETGFFVDNGGPNWKSAYGEFFLEWYSGLLVEHADKVLRLARRAFPSTRLMGEVGSAHWWYLEEAHPAELTAGVYNTNVRNGYTAIAEAFSKHGADLAVSGMELMDSAQPRDCQCAPSALITQTEEAATNANTGFIGLNSEPRFDRGAYEQILSHASVNERPIAGFFFRRLGETLVDKNNLERFRTFVAEMSAID